MILAEVRSPLLHMDLCLCWLVPRQPCARGLMLHLKYFPRELVQADLFHWLMQMATMCHKSARMQCGRSAALGSHEAMLAERACTVCQPGCCKMPSAQPAAAADSYCAGPWGNTHGTQSCCDLLSQAWHGTIDLMHSSSTRIGLQAKHTPSKLSSSALVCRRPEGRTRSYTRQRAGVTGVRMLKSYASGWSCILTCT